jgi:hypothetical protein
MREAHASPRGPRGIGSGGTVVRLGEKHVPGGGKYWIGPHVAEIEPIGMVYDGLRLSVAVCWHSEGISNFRVRP